MTTVATMKRELGITGSADHEFLEDLILQASSTIEGWCRRTFAREDLSETFRLAAERTVLHLARWLHMATLFQMDKTTHGRCGLTGQLLVRIGPADGNAEPDPCLLELHRSRPVAAAPSGTNSSPAP